MKLSSWGWFDEGGHGALTVRYQRIRSVRMDPVSLEFSSFSMSGKNDDAPGEVHLPSHLKTGLKRMTEETVQHLDNVLIGMSVVVE